MGNIGRAFNYLMVGLTSTIGAYLGSQTPYSAADYVNRVSEKLSIDALNLQGTINEYLHVAKSSNIEETILEFSNMAQQFLNKQDSLLDYSQQLVDLPLWKKPFQFVYEFDLDLIVDTLANHAPTLSLDEVQIAYAGLGLLAGWLLYTVPSNYIQKISQKPSEREQFVIDLEESIESVNHTDLS